MFALDLFNTDHERRLSEGAVDKLEQRRIDDLAMKMDDLVARAKQANTTEAKAALMKEFQKCKAERDSYYKVRNETMGYGTVVGEEGIPGNVPADKIPGKEDLLKGKGRSYYEAQDQKKNSKEVAESQRLNRGDPIVVTGPNEFEGKTGEIAEFSPSGSFVVVDLYNHGRHSMHLSDIAYNEYADQEQDEEDDWYDDEDLDESANPKLDAIVKNIQARIPAAAVKRPEIIQRIAQMVAQADPSVQDAVATAQQLVQQYGQGAPAPAQTNVNDLKSAARRGVVNAPYPKTSAGTPTYAQQHSTFEGFQDFNKVEPYAVCLAGKPVKKFDYYEEARRFHDNWKKKLYREGNQAKADKITLLPLGLDEVVAAPPPEAPPAIIAPAPATKYMAQKPQAPAALSHPKVSPYSDDESTLKVYKPEQYRDVNESTGIHPKLVTVLKQRGYKGPYKLSKLPKWLASLGGDIADGDNEIMVTGNDPEYDAWVVYNAYGPYAFGQEMGYQLGTAAKVIKDTVPLDEAGSPAQQAAIAIAKKKEQDLDEEEGRVDPILLKALKRMPDGLATHREVLDAAYDAYAMEKGYLAMKGNYGVTDVYIPKLMSLYKNKHGLTFNEGSFGRNEEFRSRERNAGLEHETNNIQIAINGKPWKVMPGKGYADSAEERSYLEGMKRWAEKKSAATGKKWTVYLTGAEVNEAATDHSKRRQRERDVDAGKPVAKQRQSKMTDYQKRRAQDKKDMELGEDAGGNYEQMNYRNNPNDPYIVYDRTMKAVILTTNSLDEAKQEAIEWAEYDDIDVSVINRATKKSIFRVNGYAGAEKYLGEEQDTSGVEQAILHRIMVAHTDLLMKFGPEKVMQAAEEVAYNVGDVDEIGTSDVSAYVAQVQQILGA